jgi:hypothetical protein
MDGVAQLKKRFGLDIDSVEVNELTPRTEHSTLREEGGRSRPVRDRYPGLRSDRSQESSEE